MNRELNPQAAAGNGRKFPAIENIKYNESKSADRISKQVHFASLPQDEFQHIQVKENTSFDYFKSNNLNALNTGYKTNQVMPHDRHILGDIMGPSSISHNSSFKITQDLPSISHKKHPMKLPPLGMAESSGISRQGQNGFHKNNMAREAKIRRVLPKIGKNEKENMEYNTNMNANPDQSVSDDTFSSPVKVSRQDISEEVPTYTSPVMVSRQDISEEVPTYTSPVMVSRPDISEEVPTYTSPVMVSRPDISEEVPIYTSPVMVSRQDISEEVPTYTSPVMVSRQDISEEEVPTYISPVAAETDRFRSNVIKILADRVKAAVKYTYISPGVLDKHEENSQDSNMSPGSYNGHQQRVLDWLQDTNTWQGEFHMVEASECENSRGVKDVGVNTESEVSSIASREEWNWQTVKDGSQERVLLKSIEKVDTGKHHAERMKMKNKSKVKIELKEAFEHKKDNSLERARKIYKADSKRSVWKEKVDFKVEKGNGRSYLKELGRKAAWREKVELDMCKDQPKAVVHVIVKECAGSKNNYLQKVAKPSEEKMRKKSKQPELVDHHKQSIPGNHAEGDKADKNLNKNRKNNVTKSHTSAPCNLEGAKHCSDSQVNSEKNKLTCGSSFTFHATQHQIKKSRIIHYESKRSKTPENGKCMSVPEMSQVTMVIGNNSSGLGNRTSMQNNRETNDPGSNREVVWNERDESRPGTSCSFVSMNPYSQWPVPATLHRRTHRALKYASSSSNAGSDNHLMVEEPRNSHSTSTQRLAASSPAMACSVQSLHHSDCAAKRKSTKMVLKSPYSAKITTKMVVL